MSRSRHMKRAAGGKATAYAGGDSNVMKEAHERKRGGKVHHHHHEGEGEEPKHRMDKRARGGKMHHHKKEHEHEHEARKHGGRMAHHGDGHTSHHEHGKMHAKPHHAPGRKRGGGVGANLTPLSTAARIKEVTKGEYAEDTPKND